MARRPSNRFGVLLVLTGFSWFLASLQLSDETVPFTIGLAAASLPLGFIVHLLLAFPEGSLGTPARRAVTAAAYFASTAIPLAAAFFWEVGPFPPGCDCPENALLITPNEELQQALVNVDNAFGLAVALSVIVILARRWRHATSPARRALAPVLWSGTLSAALGVIFFSTNIAGGDAVVYARLATFASLILVPLAFLAGLLRVRLARSAVSRLVLELGGSTAPGRLREAIARALGDPSLTVAYWLPGGGDLRRFHGPSGRAAGPGVRPGGHPRGAGGRAHRSARPRSRADRPAGAGRVRLRRRRPRAGQRAAPGRAPGASRRSAAERGAPAGADRRLAALDRRGRPRRQGDVLEPGRRAALRLELGGGDRTADLVHSGGEDGRGRRAARAPARAARRSRGSRRCVCARTGRSSRSCSRPPRSTTRAARSSATWP